MSRNKRLAAAVLVAGTIVGAGALPASAADRGADYGDHGEGGYHRGYDGDGYRAGGWWREGGYHRGYDGDGHRAGGWWREGGYHRGFHRPGYREGWLHYRDERVIGVGGDR